MKITVLGFLVFCATLLLVFGVWQFLWIVIHKKGYELEKQEGESFYDFLFRYYEDDWAWKLRKRFGWKWFYYSKAFLIFIKIKGVILIGLGVALAVALFFLSNTEYAEWLLIEL